MHHIDGHRISDRRIVWNMVTLCKKSRYCMLTFCKVNCFTGGAITHMDMSIIFSNWFAQICRNICVNDQVMMTFARVDTFLAGSTVYPLVAIQTCNGLLTLESVAGLTIANAFPALEVEVLPPPVWPAQPANKNSTNNVITLEMIFINSSQKKIKR